MLDEREIRIGNWLFIDGKASRVAAIDLDLDDESVTLISFIESYSSVGPVELNYGRVR
jgi:hypothetical protein